MACGQDYGPRTIDKIRPWLMNVYVQNYRISPAGKTIMQTWTRGPVKLDAIGSWEPGGVDYPEVFGALRHIGRGEYHGVRRVQPLCDARGGRGKELSIPETVCDPIARKAPASALPAEWMS